MRLNVVHCVYVEVVGRQKQNTVASKLENIITKVLLVVLGFCSSTGLYKVGFNIPHSEGMCISTSNPVVSFVEFETGVSASRTLPQGAL
jgi:hypothetical protein